MNISTATEILGQRPTSRVWNNIPTLRYRYVYWKSMCKDKESLLQTISGEHIFQMKQVGNLKEALLEMKEVCGDGLIYMMIDSTLDKYEIDKLVHTRKLFPNPQGLTGEK